LRRKARQHMVPAVTIIDGRDQHAAKYKIRGAKVLFFYNRTKAPLMFNIVGYIPVVVAKKRP
jgi:lysylphosphatidylglycerol synthetase-like protein (DUF2156 family)